MENKYNAEVTEGDMIDCTGAKRGISSNGRPWMLVPVKAKEGYNRLTLFTENPEDCQTCNYLKVKKIKKVSVSSRKSADGSKYYTDMSVYVVAEPLSSLPNMGMEINDDPLASMFG